MTSISFLIICADYNRVAIACKRKGQTLDEVMQNIDTVIVGHMRSAYPSKRLP